MSYANQRDPDLGRKLYMGAISVPAQLRGQDIVLPPMASRCVNCHSSASSQASGKAYAAADKLAQNFGPVLEAGMLSNRQSRRGGPASSYELASFCRVLKTGIDPAHILISRNMPVFQMNDEQCEALWQFLNQTR
ncbi:hypothetical protein [Undibacterium rugosum]|uniref:hypothetical protein n=1 Tax=Undibacterium rugosum TaxID=2762291 RepID=UPI001B827384|nr:hypothetical protein [Undibacterium rugosum]MBR7779701.1 hypothetical protein [Undibacterium rugosum]